MTEAARRAAATMAQRYFNGEFSFFEDCLDAFAADAVAEAVREEQERIAAATFQSDNEPAHVALDRVRRLVGVAAALRREEEK